MLLSTIFAASFGAALSPSAAAAPVAAAVQIRVGGFRAADVNDERVQNAAAFAAQQLGGELSEVESAEQQVVAGMNFKLVILTEDGARWRVTVHQPLRGELRLGSQERLDVAEAEDVTEPEAETDEE